MSTNCEIESSFYCTSPFQFTYHLPYIFRHRDCNKPSLNGWKCDYCHALANSFSTWKRDQNVKMRDRATMFETVTKILRNPEDGLYKSKVCKTAVNRLLKTNDRFYNAKGLALKLACTELRTYKSLVVPEDKVKANSFLHQVNDIIESNPEWENQIEIDMLKHSMAKATSSKKGGKATHLHEKPRMLWVAMYQKSPHTTRMLAANINDPSERNLRRRAAELDNITHNVGGKTILEKTDEDATNQMCEYIKELSQTFGRGRDHPIRVSYSIDLGLIEQVVENMEGLHNWWTKNCSQGTWLRIDFISIVR